MNLPDDLGARYALSALQRAIRDHCAGRPYEEPADLIAAADAVRAIIQTQDAVLARQGDLAKEVEAAGRRIKHQAAAIADQEREIAEMGRQVDQIRRSVGL